MYTTGQKFRISQERFRVILLTEKTVFRDKKKKKKGPSAKRMLKNVSRYKVTPRLEISHYLMYRAKKSERLLN